MTPQQRTVLRSKIGAAYLTVQNEYRKDGITPEEFMPEVIGVLLSLTAMLAKKSGLDRAKVNQVVELALKDEFG
jgi:hypothetical protein